MSAMTGLRRDFADWRRREPVWCVLTCAFTAFFAAWGVLLLVAGDARWFYFVGLAFADAAYIGAKLEVSHAWHVAGRIADGQAVSMTRFDPETGTTTVYDLSRGDR